jgi:uncharacterized protein
MDRRDRQAIDSLFKKLANVERQCPPRDPEAKTFMDEQMASQPHAPYYMAQTIVVQEQALNAAQARIEELERQVGSIQNGGLASSMSNVSRQLTGSVPRAGRTQPTTFDPMSPRAGGGFLAGAAQTAMGVAGGILLGNMIAGIFGSDQAQADQAQSAEPQDGAKAEAEDVSLDDTGPEEAGFGDLEL